MPRSDKLVYFSLSLAECPQLINIPLTPLFHLAIWPCGSPVWPQTHSLMFSCSAKCLCQPMHTQGTHTNISLCLQGVPRASTGPAWAHSLQNYIARACRQICSHVAKSFTPLHPFSLTAPHLFPFVF